MKVTIKTEGLGVLTKRLQDMPVKVSAKFIKAAGRTAMAPVLRDAKRAGIPVIITDRSIATTDESLYACFIGSDFLEEGRMAAEWLAKVGFRLQVS